MTREDAVKLCAYVEAACPSQQMTEATPDVWADIIPARYTLGQCKAAVTAMIRRGERFTDLGAVCAEVQRVRDDNIDRYGTPDGPGAVDGPDAHRAVTAAEGRTADEIIGEIRHRGGRSLKAIPPPDYGRGAS